MFSFMVLNFFLFFSSSSLFREDRDAFQVEGSSESRRDSILWKLLSVWQCRWVSFWRKLLQPELYSAYQRQVGFCSMSSIMWVLESRIMVVGNIETLTSVTLSCLFFFSEASFRNTWTLILLLDLVVSVMCDLSFTAYVPPAIQFLPHFLAFHLH